MKNLIATAVAGAAMTAGLAMSAPAQAQSGTQFGSPSSMPSAWGTPLAAGRLAGQRGGAALMQSDMTLVGTTSNNSASHMATGTNTIAAGAFANMSGLPLVVQNSGANVLIQNAVIVNLHMQ